MNFDITKVSIDGDVDDLTEEQLRELVSKFQDAQESNVAEFSEAVEEIPDVEESTIEDFEQAREDLVEEITEAEKFDEVPLSEDSLENCDFSDLRDWKEFVTAEDVEDDTDDSGADDFDDFGKKAPVDDEGGESDFAEDALDEMQGLTL
jgi:hypothetical protein